MAKFLMFQGTGSSVGKSLLTAGFIRFLARQGWRVLPFKAQNMSLNSGVTPQGEEIGRAQILQAQAAFAQPDSRMNPILLKPQGKATTQVIVRGKVWGTLSAGDYYEHLPFFWEIVKDSLHSLARECELVVIEGAGSPAEINLREKDIVNMKVATHLECPVFLIGDIERGGVFASLYGTWALLPSSERNLLRGFVINKFRGDLEILKPGLEEIEKLTRVPVLGVLPYLSLSLDEEDSLSERLSKNSFPSAVKIGVLRFPHLANYTDFQPLAAENDVGLSYLQVEDDWSSLDLLILPGTKNTIEDLSWFWERGGKEKIEDFLDRGGKVLGICGGFQMLGEKIKDPLGIESGQKEITGLGLLKMETELKDNKTLQQVKGYWATCPAAKVEGYEIHQGESRFWTAYPPFFLQEGGQKEGAVREGRIFGTYLHGLFDRSSFRRHFLNWLREEKDLPPLAATPSWSEVINQELDRWSETLEKYLAVGQMKKIIGLEK
ncbi:MAG: adenosylcobyric acid synthase [Candidatus Atribacteria bacterium]|nr:adenosylcobyric acid synthase [Candidatus Atribacteria bacterium]